MAGFTLNSVTSYAIRGMEMITPSLREFQTDIKKDVTVVMDQFKASDEANAKDIANLAMHAMQPVKYLFWSSLMVTWGLHLAEKYTPIFGSVFKVIRYVFTFFTFDLFMSYAHTYKEFYYFDVRAKEGEEVKISWKVFIAHVDDYSRSILSSTFLLSSSRFLSSDVNGGLVKIFEFGKEPENQFTAEKIREILPGLGTWFRLQAAVANPPNEGAEGEEVH